MGPTDTAGAPTRGHGRIRDSRIWGIATRWLSDIRLIAIACVLTTTWLYSLPELLPLWIFVPCLAACLMRFPGRALLASVLMICAWASLVGQWQMADRLPASQDGTTRWITGHVSGLPEGDAFRTRFRFETDTRPHHLRLSWYDMPGALRPGDCLRAKVKLSAPHGSANPGGFDYEQWLWREGIDATGYIKSADRCAPPAFWSLDRWRAAALARIAPYVEESPMRGIVEALTLGVRSHITDAQWQTLRATGTTHLVAISGLHIGLVALWLSGLVFWFAVRLPGRRSARVIASVIAIAGAIAYAALAGWALPTQRAVIMVVALMVALSLARQITPGHALAWAALVVLMISPASVLAPGFWLSFGAVAWLIALSNRLRGPIWLRVIGLQLGLVAALMPLTLWFFQQASLVSPFINAGLIPLAGGVVPIVLLAVVATLIWPAGFGGLLTHICAWLAHAWPVLDWFASWPQAAFHFDLTGWVSLTGLLAASLWLIAPLPWRVRWLGVLFLLPMAASVANHEVAPGSYRLTVLDVGQGLASVVRTAHHTLVFDTGPAYRTGFDAGAMIVVPYLRHVGRTHVDRLILSHGDMDHAGGAAAIAYALTVDRRMGARSGHPCRAGQHWRWDGVTFRMRYPGAADVAQAQSSNERSCVLEIIGPGGRALLTGDIEAPAEQALVERVGTGLRADVLVVPHHGSNTSSTAPFLANVDPALALVSAGWHNRWDFPRLPVLRRLAQAQARVLNTANQGALTVYFPADGSPWRVRSWRRMRRRFWATPPGDG